MRRTWIARAGDALFFGWLAFALVVDLTGGFRIGRGWYRITATDPLHLAGVAIVIVVVRHLLVWQPSLRTRLTARRAARGQPAVLVPGAVSPRQWLIATAFFLASTLWILHDQVWTITGLLDRGDPLFSMWRLAWIAHQIVADPRHLFDANIFHPALNTLAYSDATLLPGIVATPFLLAGVPVAVFHGLLYLASFLLAGLAMFGLTFAVTRSMVPALLAGLLFGFYPYRIATYSHLEMQGVFLMPMALLALLHVVDRGRIADGVRLGLFVALELLWSLYLGGYLIVGLATAAIVLWAAGHFRIRERWKALLVGAVVMAAIAVPYSRPYWVARDVVGERPRNEAWSFSAQPGDLFGANDMNTLWAGALEHRVNTERQLFPGGTALLIGAAALIPPVAPVAAMSAAGLIIAFDAALGVNGTVFTWLYDNVPSFRAFRVPARFGMVMGLFLALLAGIGASRLLSRARGLGRGAIVAGVFGAALIELRPALVLVPTPTTPPAIYAALPADSSTVIAEIPMPLDDLEYWIDPTYLYYSTFHWRTLLNGYSGFTPAWYPRLMVASREFPTDESVEVFRRAGATVLIVHEEFYTPARYQEVVGGIAGRRDLRLLGRSRDPRGERRLYQLLPASRRP